MTNKKDKKTEWKSIGKSGFDFVGMVDSILGNGSNATHKINKTKPKK